CREPSSCPPTSTARYQAASGSRACVRLARRPIESLWAIRRPPTVARNIEDDDFDGLFADIGNGASHRECLRGDLLAKYADRDWRGVFTAARLAGMSIAF